MIPIKRFISFNESSSIFHDEFRKSKAKKGGNASKLINPKDFSLNLFQVLQRRIRGVFPFVTSGLLNTILKTYKYKVEMKMAL